jgi:hypothetical protein
MTGIFCGALASTTGGSGWGGAFIGVPQPVQNAIPSFTILPQALHCTVLSATTGTGASGAFAPQELQNAALVAISAPQPEHLLTPRMI